MKKTYSPDELIKEVRDKNPSMALEYVSNLHDINAFLRYTEKGFHNIMKIKEMITYFKYADIPYGFDIIIKNMWAYIEPNYNEVKGRFRKTENSIEVFNELVIGNSLRVFCEANNIKLVYQPKFNTKNPDWLIQRANECVYVEVSTLNNSKTDTERDACKAILKNQVKRLMSQNIGYSHLCDVDLDISWFKIPEILKSQKELRYNEIDEYCANASQRVFAWLIQQEKHKRIEFVDNKTGLRVLIGEKNKELLTARGHQTDRIKDPILNKVEKYKEIISKYPLIIAIANRNWPRTKTLTQSGIAEIIYEPESLLSSEYSCVSDKKSERVKLMLEIKKHQESIAFLPGLLFYDMEYYNNLTPSYEYFVNPDCMARSALLNMLNTYLQPL